MDDIIVEDVPMEENVEEQIPRDEVTEQDFQNYCGIEDRIEEIDRKNCVAGMHESVHMFLAIISGLLSLIFFITLIVAFTTTAENEALKWSSVGLFIFFFILTPVFTFTVQWLTEPSEYRYASGIVGTIVIFILTIILLFLADYVDDASKPFFTSAIVCFCVACVVLTMTFFFWNRYTPVSINGHRDVGYVSMQMSSVLGVPLADRQHQSVNEVIAALQNIETSMMSPELNPTDHQRTTESIFL